MWQASAVDEVLVRQRVGDGVARLTLDSPGNRNALSAALLAQLSAAVTAVTAEESVRVVVLDHTGGVFCSGVDLREASGASAEEQPVVAFPRLLRQLWESPKPVLARVAGKARAGGVGLIAACDLALAADTCDFAFTEVRLGLVPAVISAVALPRMAPRTAQALLLTGEVFDARTAAAAGLITAAVPAAELDAEVTRHATMLAAGGPLALAETKQLLQRHTGVALAEELQRLSALSARHFAGEEGQEGIAAFAARRPARWVPPALT